MNNNNNNEYYLNSLNTPTGVASIFKRRLFLIHAVIINVTTALQHYTLQPVIMKAVSELATKMWCRPMSVDNVLTAPM